ncbi:MAG: hypothetical protein R3C09_23430 [Pirellulaceae bacterium]|jgi:hypothetical protein
MNVLCPPALLLFFLEAYSIRRVLIHRNPHPADSNILWTIDSQKADRCIAYVRQPDQFRRVIVPAKMFPPVIALRMKQTRLLPGGRDVCQHSIRLESVAGGAGKTQISQYSRAAMRRRHNMLNLEHDRRQVFRRLTVRASVRELQADLFP